MLGTLPSVLTTLSLGFADCAPLLQEYPVSHRAPFLSEPYWLMKRCSGLGLHVLSACAFFAAEKVPGGQGIGWWEPSMQKWPGGHS